VIAAVLYMIIMYTLVASRSKIKCNIIYIVAEMKRRVHGAVAKIRYTLYGMQ